MANTSSRQIAAPLLKKGKKRAFLTTRDWFRREKPTRRGGILLSLASQRVGGKNFSQKRHKPVEKILGCDIL